MLSSLATAVVEGICAHLLWTGNKYARTIILLQAYATLIFVWFDYFLTSEIVGSREIVAAINLVFAPILILLDGEYNNLRKRRIAVLLSIVGLFCANKRIWNRRVSKPAP